MTEPLFKKVAGLRPVKFLRTPFFYRAPLLAASDIPSYVGLLRVALL